MDCLNSLYSTTKGLSFEVIIVDNASGDRCFERIGRDFPAAVVVELEENIGFARANNLGATIAKGRNLLFLNPDTVVIGDAILRMSQSLDSSTTAGVVGGRLLNPDNSVQFTSIQPFPSLANQLLAIEALQKRWPRLPLWGNQALFESDLVDPVEVEVVSGACIMLKRTVFQAAKAFSEDYYMYAEESDLCEKVRRVGWKVLHVPSALVVHFGGQSTKSREDHFSSIVMREALFRLFRKFRGTSYANLYRACMLASALVRLALLSPMALQPISSHVRQSARCSFRRWVRIARWSLMLEPWANAIGKTK